MSSSESAPTNSACPSRAPSDRKSNIKFCDLLNNGRIGQKSKLGTLDEIAFKLYNAFDSYVVSTDCGNDTNKYKGSWGGIFNLEFSFDGKLVVAACEAKQILLYDAANQSQINYVERAHQNCVNCVRFLTDKTFATCSDDNSIKIWDIRKMKTAVRTLHGHLNWVKNIEWSEQEKVLVTSAFDGSIYSWNIDTFSESNSHFDKIFLLNGLMRMKLTPDGSKMIISTTNGYMIIIHHLNLMTLATDLKSFRPDIYRLMQTSDQTFPVSTVYNYLFSTDKKRNRIEIIDDFPNEAEVISSLHIHPQGWSAISRNINGLENEEWTAVHDIQDKDPKEYLDAYSIIEGDNSEDSDPEEPPSNRRPTDLWMGYTYLEDYENLNQIGERNIRNNINDIPSMGIVSSGLIGLNTAYNTYFEQYPEEKNKLIRNVKRMTHFVKEKNVGKGFIKELCCSSDGRIICSPYGNGIRLLGFNEKCSELSDCVPEEPKELNTIVEMNDYHRDTVVSCKFSPMHYQLVSGCLGSEIKWYQPVL